MQSEELDAATDPAEQTRAKTPPRQTLSYQHKLQTEGAKQAEWVRLRPGQA